MLQKCQKNYFKKRTQFLFHINAVIDVDLSLRRFGGWALSEKTWIEERQHLIKSLGNRIEEVDTEFYATVTYQHPLTKENRRNEVWLVRQKDTKNLEQSLIIISFVHESCLKFKLKIKLHNANMK